MGQVSSRIYNILGSDSAKDGVNNENIVNGNSTYFSLNSDSDQVRSVSSKTRKVNKERKCISDFFSSVTPRLPLKRSRQISPGAEVPQSIKDIFSPEKRARMDDYLDFLFLNDYQSINYIKNSKVMFIMRGLPGSGKSTVCKSLKKKYDVTEIFSADNFFMIDGIYEYDVSKIGDAHEQCHQNAIEAVQNQCNVIIIDNSNVRLWEMQFYLKLAKEFNYIALIIEPKTPWKKDLQTLVKNNSHNVTEEIMLLKINSFEETIPLYYGWFLNEKDSYLLYLENQSLFKEAYEFLEFKRDIRAYTGCQTFEELMNYFEKPRGELMFHCTSKYYKSERDDVKSQDDDTFDDKVGKAFAIEVIGFFLTPRTIGARLKLTSKQKELWAQDDNEKVPNEFWDVSPTEYERENKGCQDSIKLDSFSDSIENDIEKLCFADDLLSDDANTNILEKVPKTKTDEFVTSVMDVCESSVDVVEEEVAIELNSCQDIIPEANAAIISLSPESCETESILALSSDSCEPESILALSLDSTLSATENDVEKSEILCAETISADHLSEHKSPPIKSDELNFKSPTKITVSKHKKKKGKSPKKKQTEIPKYVFNCEESKIPTTISETYTDLKENRFQPTPQEGKRAHITFGCGEDVAAATTGLDLIFVNELEQKANESTSEKDCPPIVNGDTDNVNSKETKIAVKTINLNGAVLKNYGYGVWVIYLENKLLASSIFAGHYRSHAARP